MTVYRHRNELLPDVLPKGGVLCEIGVDEGLFAHELYRVGAPAKMHLVDLWCRHPDLPEDAEADDRGHLEAMAVVQRSFLQEIRFGKVLLHQGYGADVLRTFPEKYLDGLHLDADHRYAEVLAELWEADRVVKDAGVVLLHDYLTAGESPIAARYGYGVVEAVDVFCNQSDWHLGPVTERQAHGGPGATSPTAVLWRR